MTLQVLGVEIRFSFWFFAVIACFALLDKEVLAYYFILPIAIHEMGHLLVMAACGIGVKSVNFTAMGVDIQRLRGRFSYGREIAVSLGGVAANAICALIFYCCLFQSMRVMFLVAANIAIALFNLAPIGNLDGGQVVRQIAERFFTPDTARWISRYCSLVVLAVLFGVAIFLAVIRYPNPTLLITCVYLAINVIFRD